MPWGGASIPDSRIEPAKCCVVQTAHIAHRAQQPDSKQRNLPNIVDMTTGSSDGICSSKEDAEGRVENDLVSALLLACDDFTAQTGREPRMVVVSLADERKLAAWALTRRVYPASNIEVDGSPSFAIRNAWVVGANVPVGCIQPVWYP